MYAVVYTIVANTIRKFGGQNMKYTLTKEQIKDVKINMSSYSKRVISGHLGGESEKRRVELLNIEKKIKMLTWN